MQVFHGGSAGAEQHLEGAAGLLDNLDGLQVGGASQPQHGVHGQLGKVVLVVRQDLAAQRRARYIQQVLRSCTHPTHLFRLGRTKGVTVFLRLLRFIHF